jgi:hypothetical protein
MRRVIKTETMERKGFAPGGFAIINTLECGHQVFTKGSAGYAEKRKCHECQRLEEGAVVTFTARNGTVTEERWDNLTRMPKRQDRG